MVKKDFLFWMQDMARKSMIFYILAIVFATTAQPGAAAARSGQFAADSLAGTPTAYYQIQTIGTYSSGHVAPPLAIQQFLNSSAAQASLPADANVPQSTQYTQLHLYNQLENLGARQFHFPIYYDPTGTKYQLNAGLKIVNESTNLTVSSDRWALPGWKVMNEPDFDWNTTCIGLSTCLFNIKNWILGGTEPVPITIYLEPTAYTYGTASGDNTAFTDALTTSSQIGSPNNLAQPFDIKTYKNTSQPWRDLENELLIVFDDNSYFSIVTPDVIMGNDSDLYSAVFKDGYVLYPALKYMKNRIIFVLTGDYVQDYLLYYPNLNGATMFVAEPYNVEATYTRSTLFVDILGPLAGVYATSFNETAADAAVKKQTAQVTETVKMGYMVRASTDWNTLEARNNYTSRFSQLMSAGAHFLQTAFPTVPTLFPSTYSAALPVRGNVQQSTRCNPVTSGQTIFNVTDLYSIGCPAVNANIPANAPAAPSSKNASPNSRKEPAPAPSPTKAPAPSPRKVPAISPSKAPAPSPSTAPAPSTEVDVAPTSSPASFGDIIRGVVSGTRDNTYTCRDDKGTASQITGSATNTTAAVFPYMVSLRSTEATAGEEGNPAHFCGGVLLFDKVILTAAHCCLQNKTADDLWVPQFAQWGGGDAPYIKTPPTAYIGATCIDDDGVDKRTISSALVHPLWNGNSENAYDICLMFTSEAFNATTSNGTNGQKVGAVFPKLARNSSFTSNSTDADMYRLQAVGWGQSGIDNKWSPQLKNATLQWRPTYECAKIIQTGNQSMTPFTRNQMCASSRTAATCSGDSGGPYLYSPSRGYDPSSDIILGLVSYGPKECRVEGSWTVFTDILAFTSNYNATCDPAVTRKGSTSDNWLTCTLKKYNFNVTQLLPI